MEGKVVRRPEIQEMYDKAKIKVNFDVRTLDMLIRYMLTDTVSIPKISILSSFLNEIDDTKYLENIDIYYRLKVLKIGCNVIFEDKIRDLDMIKFRIHDANVMPESEMENILRPNGGSLNESEANVISKAISDRYRYVIVNRYIPTLMETLDKLDRSTYESSYVDLVFDLKNTMERVMVELDSTETSDGLIKSFNFADNNKFYDLMDLIVTKAKKPGSVLYTGIKKLNDMLSPGFEGKRLYTFIGGSGKFKSGTLLNIADQIRRFNPQIKPIENGRRKTILFITMENSIEETIERIYDMYSDLEDEMLYKTTDEVIDTLRSKGEFLYSLENGIDIEFRYYGNLEINTNKIRTIIHELRDQKKDTICVILDYLKRIDSVRDHRGDERIRLSFVTKELKNIALDYEIPIITAMQINREGNKILELSELQNDEDPLRGINASNIGNCWDIIEDSDWVSMININGGFLSFKNAKIRGKKIDKVYNPNNMSVQNKTGTGIFVNYFNQPFTNSKCIRVATDVNTDIILAKPRIYNNIETMEDYEKKLIKERYGERTVWENPAINMVLGANPTFPADPRTANVFRGVTITNDLKSLNPQFAKIDKMNKERDERDRLKAEKEAKEAAEKLKEEESKEEKEPITLTGVTEESSPINPKFLKNIGVVFDKSKEEVNNNDENKVVPIEMTA
jgi:replicative DNA helicase